MGIRRRHKPYKKIARQKDELLEFLKRVLLHAQSRLRRPMTRAEIEATLEQAVAKIVEWLEEQHQRSILTSASPSLPLKTIAERVTFRREHQQLLAEISTGLWRLRKSLVNPQTGQPMEGANRAYRHLLAVWELIQEAGYIIQDHTRQPLSSRPMVKIITYEYKPGIESEIISETIKPSVYFRNDAEIELIQAGEVVVARPTVTSD